jgi:bilirubin oxidase
VGITAVNAFRGQAGFYIVSDPAEEAALNLPQGAYDIPIVLTDKEYTQQAALVTPEGETDCTFCSHINITRVHRS